MLKMNEEGVVVIASYDPALLSFEHDGMEIRNPFLSDCGRFYVDPAEVYGFTESWTGGGCKALDKLLPDGGFIRLTCEDGSDVPDPEDLESAQIGRFNAEGDQLASASLHEVRMSHEMDADEEERPAAAPRGLGM